MQLVVFQLVSGVVTEVVRHVYDSIRKVWAEAERNKEDEFILSPVALKEPSHRIRINQY